VDTKGSISTAAVVVNGILMVLKVGVGLAVGSVAMISDGIHSATDMLSALLSWLTIRISGRPADCCHPYGHQKYENLAALAQGVMVLAAGVIIGREAIMRLLAPQPLAGMGWGMVVTLVSIGAHTLVCSRMLRIARQTHSPALKGNALHMLTDIGSSLAVLIGLILTRLLGWLAADAVAALLVTGLVFWGAVKLVGEAIRDLVDSGIEPAEYRYVVDTLHRHTPPLVGYHKLRTRRVGQFRYLEAHLEVDGALSVEQAHLLCTHLEKHICQRIPGSRLLFHVEPAVQQKINDNS
jgi:cation diffusion facilitator family transporter